MFLRRETPRWQLQGSLSGDTKMGMSSFFSVSQHAEGGTAFDEQHGSIHLKCRSEAGIRLAADHKSLSCKAVATSCSQG